MAKILLEDIKKEVENQGWKVLSTEYKNLKEEMQFECPEGHTVFLNWEKGRRKLTCPICNQNPYKDLTITAISKPQGARRVLALDQSTKVSGWSIFDDDKLVSYGIFQTKSDDEMKRCSEVKSWLLSMIDNWKPDCLGLEGIQYQEKMGVTTFETLAELKGILRNTLYENNIQTIVCPTNTWRAHCGVKGQALPNSMKIPTPSGDKLVGEIKKGDYLFDALGNPTKVLQVFPQGKRRIWKVVFADGRIIDCSEDHLWGYHTYRQRAETRKNRKFKISSTKEIQEKGIYSGKSKNYNILVPYCKPVQYPSKDFNITPYVIGAMLGDGSFCLGRQNCRVLQFSSKDSVLPNKIGKIMNWKVEHSYGNNSYYFYDNKNNKNVQIIEFLKDFPELINKNSKNKFIPIEYLTGSIAQRIELLQGLLDTDGSCSNGRVVYTTISKVLAQQVQKISWSLGLSSNITKIPPRGFGKEESYSVSIYGNPEIKKLLFTLEEKKKKVEQCTLRKYTTNAIVNIVPTDVEEEMTCFLVDNDEHLFLAENYIVTHNTRQDKKNSMKYLVKKWYDVSVTDDIADAIGIGKYVTETAIQRKKVTFWI